MPRALTELEIIYKLQEQLFFLLSISKIMVGENSNKNQSIAQLTLEQLSEIIKECVSDEVQSIIPHLKKAISDSVSPKLYTRQEAAKLLNVTTTTLYNWMEKGILIPIKVGRRRLYTSEQIEALRPEVQHVLRPF